MLSSLLHWLSLSVTVVVLLMLARAQDIKVSKKISVGGTSFTSDTYVKGARERSETSVPGAPASVAIHQCDLKRTLMINDQNQSYLVTPDPQNEDATDAAALLTGAPPSQSGGKIDLTSTITDTGERKQMFGYQARHLKTSIVAESAANSCSSVHQKLEIDGWYADISKDFAGCARVSPPIRQGESCHDTVVLHTHGKGKPGFPLAETMTIQNGDAQPLTMNIEVADVSRQTLSAGLFDIPSTYRQVTTSAELYAAPVPVPPAQATAAYPQQASPAAPYSANAAALMGGANPIAAMSPMAAMSPAIMSQAALLMRPGMGGFPGMGGQPAVAGTLVATPQALGPKVPGKLRIGVVSPDAQVGQGTSSGMDYSTPIRNAMIQYMNGPAVEVAALDSRIPLQIQAESQQKQCDFLLYSSVTVKHTSGGGFGKFMKMAGPASSIVPMAGAMKGMGAAAAASAASSMAAETAAMNSLANFSGQIKQKDEVSMTYQLVPAGQQAPKLNNTLKAKASSDGQDVLTPLIQEMANSVLTEAAKK